MFTVHNLEMKKVERLLYTIADSQKFLNPKDKLTKLIQQGEEFLAEELSEDDLQMVTAAVKPAIPKYKLMK